MGKWQAMLLFTLAPTCGRVKRKLAQSVCEGSIAVVSEGKYSGKSDEEHRGKYDGKIVRNRDYRPRWKIPSKLPPSFSC